MGYNRTLGHFTNSQELATVWASGQNYIVDQLVLDNDKLYRCNTAHTSGATFAGDSAYWTGINPGSTIGIAGGGTGQTTATAAFDALAPTTTAGDLIVHNGTDNVRLPVGTDGQMIVADSSQTNKLKWATVPQGSKNYVTYSNFENNATTGWSLFNTTLDANKIPNGAITAGPPVTNPLSALAVSASSPLAGSYSLSVTSAGSINAAQGFITDVLTIDREDQAKVLTFSFYYEALTTNMNFSGTSSNTWAIYIHDGTNWIQPAGVYGMTQSSGAGLVTGTFQTNATGTSYRVAVICINGTSGAVSMRFDDFKLGPQTAPIGPVVTDWVDRGAITITGSTSNPTKGATAVDKMWTRRVGDNLEVRIEYVQSATGSAGSGDYLVSLPAGFSIDTNKVTADSAIEGGASDYTLNNSVGSANLGVTNNNLVGAVCVFDATRIRIFGITTDGVGVNRGAWGSTFYSLNTANVFMTASFSVPISGWSSQVQLSNDTDTRVVAASFRTSTARTINNASPTIIYETTQYDTHGAYNSATGIYTVPVSGFYKVSGGIETSNTAFGGANLVALYLKKNTVFDSAITAIRAQNAVTTLLQSVGSTTIQCNAGDQLTIGGYSDTATTLLAGVPFFNFVTIERLSGPSVVAATETVALQRSSGSGAQINSSVTTYVDFPVANIDTHNAWVSASGVYNPATGTWSVQNPVYRVPVSGVYQMSATVGFTTNTFNSAYNSITLFKNAAGFADGSNAGSSTSTQYQTSASGIVRCNAGDLLGVFVFQDTGGARNLQAFSSVSRTQISIVRVGN